MMASTSLNRIRAASIALPLLVVIPFVASAAGDGKWHGGADIYSKVCGYCHQVGVGPVIKGRQLPPEYIEMVVRHGFQGMPAFPASFIDDQSLQDIANYVSQSPATKK
jgi:4-cresol dehydrogenase (hydroxylating) cytochrome subunit